MLKKNESKIMKKLFDNLTRTYTINELSHVLGQKYVQTYRTVRELEKKKLIKLDVCGKSKVISPDFSEYQLRHLAVEIERTLQIKDKQVWKIYDKLTDIDKNFICVLFGSHANNTQRKDSDIDLLFVVKDTERFERDIRNRLALYNVDIQVVTEDNLLEMWRKKELNVGNEILERHVLLSGYEQFLRLLRRKDGY